MLLLILFLPLLQGQALFNSKEETCSSEKEEGCGCGSLKRDSTLGSKTPQASSSQTQSDPSLTNMVRIPAGNYTMGTDSPVIVLDAESPSRAAWLDGYYYDKYEVSNADFSKFVSSTKHRTDAEVYGDSFVLDGLLSEAENAKVFNSVAAAPWWLPVQGASWDHPEGIDTGLEDRWDHPVIHVSWNDANAYCAWAGKRLPTEAEFEAACQANATTLFPWGDELKHKGVHQTNLWQGDFPTHNSKEDGWFTTSPVTSFGPNEVGVYNLIGNVWEWVDDWWTTEHSTNHRSNPRGPKTGQEKVKKGGSFMCHKKYCYRYRCPARTKTSADTTGLNVGFRCAKSAK